MPVLKGIKKPHNLVANGKGLGPVLGCYGVVCCLYVHNCKHQEEGRA